MKLLLKIAYDGRAFHGFQTQPSHRTVQETLTETLSELFGEKMLVTGCSRTDAGVHAKGFVVSVEPADRRSDWLKIPAEKVHRAANNTLPCDISVLGAFKVYDDSFHPRYSVVGKKYVYKIRDSITPSPFTRGLVTEYGKALTEGGVKLMNDAASRFVGRHDFSSFMAAGSKITDPVREVFSASVAREERDVVSFAVSADGFLYNMVRIMAGTLIDVAEGRLSPDGIKDVMEARDRAAAGATAPPDGLYLEEVTYPFDIEWAAD
ncbi:MAG: tRNA pseudouridine(38-40) synthase TruA [Clostridia bacterium]|nr:tRNA pseudouridine(38-40) synthase TruA [Clostridia bacterium]